MAMKTPRGRDDRKDLERTDSDATGRKSSPGLDASGRSRSDVTGSGAEGGSGISGQGMRRKRDEDQKGEIRYGSDPTRQGEVHGEGEFNGRESQRGPSSGGTSGRPGTANQLED